MDHTRQIHTWCNICFNPFSLFFFFAFRVTNVVKKERTQDTNFHKGIEFAGMHECFCYPKYVLFYNALIKMFHFHCYFQVFVANSQLKQTIKKRNTHTHTLWLVQTFFSGVWLISVQWQLSTKFCVLWSLNWNEISFDCTIVFWHFFIPLVKLCFHFHGWNLGFLANSQFSDWVSGLWCFDV